MSVANDYKGRRCSSHNLQQSNVTAVYTVTHGQSDDGTLCGLDLPFQITQDAGEGASRSDPWLQGAIFEGHTEKILRTFSGPSF